MPKVWEIDPLAGLDYRFDWSEWLVEDDVIASYSLTVDDGVTLEKDSSDDEGVTIWVSGMDKDRDYRVRCHIVTTQEREDTRTVTFLARDR